MNIKVSNRDIIWSYLGTFMSLFANVITLPFIIFFLDGDMLGLWYIFISLGSIASLFDFGFSVTFSRNITYCWSGAQELKKENVEFAKNRVVNYVLLKEVISTCKWIYLLISIVTIMLMGIFGTMYIFYISKGINGSTHIWAWGIYLCSIFLNLYYGYYAAFLRGVGALSTINKNTIISRVLQIVITIVLLYLNCGIVGACVGYLLYGIVFRSLGKITFYSYCNIGTNLKKVIAKCKYERKLELFSIVWHNAWRDGLVSISMYLCNQASTIMCSLFLSLEETGVYSLGLQIATAVATVSVSLYSTYQPAIQSAYINRNKEKIKEIMSLIVLVFIVLFILGTGVVLVIGLPILRIIKPSAVISAPVLIGICISQFVIKLRNCYTSYFSCTNRLPYVKSFMISSAICILLSYIFLSFFNMGVWGLIIAQIVSQIIFNFWYWPLKVHDELGYSIKDIFVIGSTVLKNKVLKSM